jgi:hypothetical protein
VPELIGAQHLVAGVVGRGAEEGKGSMGVPVPGSPGLRRRWSVNGEGGGGESSCAGRSGLRNGARRSGGGAVGGGDAGVPFYRSGGGAGRPGIGGERGVAVVCHNGGGGGCFGRGSAGVVVGSDEGGTPAVTGAEGASEGGACTHKAAAVAAAVGLGRKMTGWGPRVGESERLADSAGLQAEAQRVSREGGPMGGEGRWARRGWQPRGKEERAGRPS